MEAPEEEVELAEEVVAGHTSEAAAAEVQQYWPSDLDEAASECAPSACPASALQVASSV